MVLYINGTSVATASLSGAFTPDGPLCFGSTAVPNLFFPGRIGGAFFWDNVACTAPQIASLSAALYTPAARYAGGEGLSIGLGPLGHNRRLLKAA
jgi:hypothetical protein